MLLLLLPPSPLLVVVVVVVLLLLLLLLLYYGTPHRAARTAVRTCLVCKVSLVVWRAGIGRRVTVSGVAPSPTHGDLSIGGAGLRWGRMGF